MDISNGINRTMGVYNSNTQNNLGIEHENKIYTADLYPNEFSLKESEKLITPPSKKRKKNHRLNTIDTDFLPDETDFVPIEDKKDNFFVDQQSLTSKAINKMNNSIKFIVENIPIVNYFYLRKKEEKIQKTIEELNKIIENTDELINSRVPYGEDGRVYQKIAEGLSNGANVIGKANKEF